MPSGKYTVNVDAGGINITKTITRSGDAAYSWEPSLPVAEAGSLSTRTDDNTGEITMTSGSHTITTGATVDVHWSTGVRYGMTVGTVSGTAVPIDLGAGDNLPTQDTAVTVQAQTNVTCNIDGDNAKLIAILLEGSSTSDTTAAHVDFQDSGGSTIAELDLVANVPRVWDITGGDNNAFTGNPITDAQCSQAGTDAARTLKIVSIEDSTP